VGWASGEREDWKEEGRVSSSDESDEADESDESEMTASCTKASCTIVELSPTMVRGHVLLRCVLLLLLLALCCGCGSSSSSDIEWLQWVLIDISPSTTADTGRCVSIGLKQKTARSLPHFPACTTGPLNLLARARL
jgi:hypothetical protein